MERKPCDWCGAKTTDLALYKVARYDEIRYLWLSPCCAADMTDYDYTVAPCGEGQCGYDSLSATGEGIHE